MTPREVRLLAVMHAGLGGMATVIPLWMALYWSGVPDVWPWAITVEAVLTAGVMVAAHAGLGSDSGDQDDDGWGGPADDLEPPPTTPDPAEMQTATEYVLAA